MTQNLIIAGLYGACAVEFFFYLDSLWRADLRARYSKSLRFANGRITRALQRFVDWCDTIQPKESRS